MIGFSNAYLDIETTGLYPQQDVITVIGIYFCDEAEGQLVQLYENNLNCDALLKAMEGTDNIYTYNGERFDLPFIKTHLGADLSMMHQHTDLMFDCWKYNLKGGFKAVLRRLGIDRETEGLSGLHAIWLWEQYSRQNDLAALDLLLKYNRDDVVNLKQLKDSLIGMKSAGKCANQ
jgi:uncharacterized protein YprB with RNaseH-like and TPR domain